MCQAYRCGGAGRGLVFGPSPPKEGTDHMSTFWTNFYSAEIDRTKHSAKILSSNFVRKWPKWGPMFTLYLDIRNLQNILTPFSCLIFTHLPCYGWEIDPKTANFWFSSIVRIDLQAGDLQISRTQMLLCMQLSINQDTFCTCEEPRAQDVLKLQHHLGVFHTLVNHTQPFHVAVVKPQVK